MKKKAFTLTELLVVVVIIGVLSAVVLPKFTKIIQTRKTTEAENVMAAVRNEQEARCMVGRNYVGQNEISKLASLPKATSKNYTYTLDAQGITATAKDGEYILQIPSYTDGRICCSEKVAGNGACDALNKDYPKCDATFLANIDQATCEAPEVTEISEPEPNICEPGTKRNTSCVCGVENGEVCNTEGTDWNSYTDGTCSLTQTEIATCACQEKPQDETQPCPEGTQGTQTRTYSCQNGNWTAGEWTGECTPVGCDPDGSIQAACVPEKIEGDKKYFYTWVADTCDCLESCLYEWYGSQSLGRNGISYEQCIKTYTPQCSSIGVSVNTLGKRTDPDCYVCGGGTFGSGRGAAYVTTVSIYSCGSIHPNPFGGKREAQWVRISYFSGPDNQESGPSYDECKEATCDQDHIGARCSIYSHADYVVEMEEYECKKS